MDCGLNDGTITVTATGGTPTYTYDAGAGIVNSNIISDLAPGNYIVTVTDILGCTGTCATEIMQLVTPSCTIGSVVNINCQGEATGSFLVSGSGGNSTNYSFTDGTTTNTDGNFTMLSAGNYIVTISEVDNPMCTSFCNVTLTEPNYFCTTAVNNNVSCNGLADGSATVIPNDGATPYTFAWDNGEMFSTAILLDAGTHTVTVTDANGCITTCTATISENPPLICSPVAISNVSCNGGADGALMVSATGGDGSYEYSLDGATFIASGVFSGLSAGAHTLTVRDGNGCESTCVGVITEPAVLICSTVSTQESDCDANDGTITITAFGGTSPFTFDANAGTVSGNVISNLGPGNFIITVTDVNGCTGICSAEILSLSAPSCAIDNIVNVACNGEATGSFIANGMGGNSTDYNFTDGSTTNTDGVFTMLAVGNYTITISEQGNPMCSSICQVTLIEPEVLTCSTMLISEVSCNGFSDGSASVMPVGGASPYSYLWDSGETTALAQTLNAGVHTVTVTDANSCTTTCSVFISENQVVTCTVTVVNNVSCNGGADGELEIIPLGGTSSYEYSIGGAFQPQSTFSGLSAGTYTLTTMDGNGCMSTCNTTISEPSLLTCTTTTTIVSDCGLNDGMITVFAFGGTAGYTYDAGAGTINANIISDLSPGNYIVTVTDANGCVGNCTTEIMGLNNPSCTIGNVVNVDCNGNATGSYLVTGMGGNSTAYTFTDGTTTNTDGSFSAIVAGNYMVTISEQANPMCNSVCAVEITEPEILNCSTTLLSDVTCKGMSDGSASVSPLGGRPPYNYAWDNGETTSIATMLNSGTHVVSITDSNGCITTCDIFISQNPALACTVVINENVSCTGESDGSLSVLSLGGDGVYEYSLDGVSFQVADVFSGLAAGAYNITTRDGNGCIITCPAIVTEPAILSCTAVSTIVSDCGQSDGSITVNALGGTAGYSYDAGSGTVTNNIISNLSPGVYIVTVTDANGCTTTCTSEIDGLQVPSCSIGSIVNVGCNGESTGSFIVTGLGGNSTNYLYTVGTVTNTNGIFTMLPAGMHIVTISEMGRPRCTSFCMAEITEPELLTCDVTLVSDVSCNGLSDGSALVTPLGGTAPFIYMWDNNETTALATALNAGIHTVTVTDINNCVTTCEVLIEENLPVSCTNAVFNTVSCNNGFDGVFQTFSEGGDGNFEFSLDGINFQTASSFADLVAGVYTVTTQDGNGCTSTCSVEITEPAPLTCSTMTTIVTDCGLNDGTITLTAFGGTQGYTFDAGVGTVTGNVVSDLAPGNYIITVTDANTCTGACSALIGGLNTPTCTIGSVVHVACNGDATGSFLVTGMGGNNMDYSFTDGTTTNTNGVFADLVAGNYIVTISEQVNPMCTSVCSVDITEPDALSCTTSLLSNVSCNGLLDGSASVLPTGGTTPYSFLWDNSEVLANASMLSAGIHTVTVTDANGCTSDCNIVVPEPEELNCTTTTTGVSDCGIIDGTITVSVMGGTAGYSYDAGLGTVTGNVIRDLSPGTYVVRVTDANGCTSTCDAVISGLNIPTCTISNVVNIDCNGNATGSYIATGTGGNSMFYNFTDGITTNTDGVFTALTAGSYIVTISEQSNPMCASFCTVEITEPETLVCGVALESDVSCNGLSDGRARVIAGGGTLPYMFLWSNGETTATATMLAAGTHSVTVTDANGCMTSCDVVVSENAELTCSLEETRSILCNGDLTGELTLTAFGGAGFYEYSLDGAPFQISHIFSGLAAGDYNVIIRDANGCTNICAATIEEPEGLSCTAITTAITDCGIADGTITVSTLGGTAGFTYDAGVGIVSSNVISGLSAGNYVVTVTDANGCSSLCTAEVQGLSLPTCSISNVVNVDCNGNASGSYLVTGAGGNSTFYNFSDGLTTNTDGVFTMISAGNYTVTISEQSNPMCASTCTVVITEPEVLSCSVVLVNNVSCNGFSDGSATVSATGGTLPISYLWPNGETTTTATMLAAGTHTITVTDANGCTTTCDIIITEPACQSLGGVIFFDDNQNGCQDGSEALVNAPVTVSLYECGAQPGTDMPLRSTTVTDGSYFFGEGSPEPGSDICLKTTVSYFVVFDLPNMLGEALDRYVFSSKSNNCALSSSASDVEPETGITSCFNPLDDDDDLDIDAGIHPSIFDLTLTKQLAVGQNIDVDLGEQVGFELVVTNLSVFPVDNITLNDIIPNGLSFDPTLNPTWTEANSIATTILSVSNGSLPSGGLARNQSAVVDIILTVNHNVPQGTPMTNVASIIGNDDNPSNDTDDQTVVTFLNDLEIVKSLSEGQRRLVNHGEQVTFDITVTNLGTSYIQSVDLSDELINDYFTLNDPNWTLDNITGIATHTAAIDLGPGESHVVSITFDVAMFTPAMTIVNNAHIDEIYDVDNDPMIDINPINDWDDQLVRVSDLIMYDLSLRKEISNDTPAPIFFDRPIEFDVIVCNDGNAPIDNFIVRDNLAAGFNFFENNIGNAGWNLVPDSTSTYEYNIASIPANSCDTLNMRALVLDNGGPWTNSAEIISATTPIGTPISETLDMSGFINNIDTLEITPSFPIGTIGNCVFKDVNGNGVRDLGEPGVPDIRVELYEGNGALFSITETNDLGEYLFTDLYPGPYYLTFVLRDDFEFTDPNQGNNDNLDSDVDNSNGPGTTAIFNLGPNEIDLSHYAGVFTCVPFGDVIWFDNNGNSQQDFEENGINGVKVEVFRLSNITSRFEKVAETISGHEPGTPSSDGYWKVCVPPGQYYVEFNVPPLLEPVAPLVGGQTLDSDVTNDFGPNTTRMIALESCTMDCDADAGFKSSNGFASGNNGGFELESSENNFFVAGRNENTSNLITWSINVDDIGVSHFQVARVLENGFLEEIGLVMTSDTNGEYSFRDYNVLESGIYKYQVSEVSFTDVVLDSRDVEVKVDMHDWKIKVYPNPVVDLLNIELNLISANDQINILLYDSSGSRVDGIGIYDVDVTSGILKYDIDVSYLSPGIYYVQTTIGSESELKKIVVVN